MSLVPTKKSERIAFFLSKVSAWTTNATPLKLTPATVADMDTKAQSAADLRADYLLKRSAAKTALDAYNGAVDQMTLVGMGLISQIRTTAKTGGDSIWQLAALPVPPVPAPMPAPGTPSDFKAALKPNGSLELSFKCSNPKGSAGTIYNVFRRTTSDGPFTFIGGAGQRKFVDATVPAGVTRVYYSIQAVRSTAVGDSAEFYVNLGIDTGGVTTATVVQSAPKLAA